MAHPLRKQARGDFGRPVPEQSEEKVETRSAYYRDYDAELRREIATDRQKLRRLAIGAALAISLVVMLAAATGHLVAAVVIIAATILFTAALVKWGTWVLENIPAW